MISYRYKKKTTTTTCQLIDEPIFLIIIKFQQNTTYTKSKITLLGGLP